MFQKPNIVYDLYYFSLVPYKFNQQINVIDY